MKALKILTLFGCLSIFSTLVKCEKYTLQITSLNHSIISDPENFADLNVSESIDEKLGVSLQNIDEQTLEEILSCKECRYLFTLKKKNGQRLNSLLKTSESFRSIGFNLNFDNSQEILSFNALHSLIDQKSFVTIGQNNSMKAETNLFKDQENKLNHDSFMGNDMDLSTKNIATNEFLDENGELDETKLKREKEVPFYKKYFWYLVGGGLIVFNMASAANKEEENKEGEGSNNQGRPNQRRG